MDEGSSSEENRPAETTSPGKSGGDKTRPPEKPRGLESIHTAREDRKKRKWPSAKVAVWFLVVVAGATVFYWYRMSQGTEKDRQKLMAEQRQLDQTLGARWYPMRDRIEQLTQSAAAMSTADFADPELAKFPFRQKSGVFLRLRVDQTETLDAIRSGAQSSLHDAFTACLIQGGDPPMAGMECKAAHDCAEGEICNDTDHCSKPSQPINLRMAYRTMHVLEPEWIREVQDGDDMRLRALRATYDEAVKTDIPVAMELVTQAKFFLLVLDEKPAPPKSDEAADAGVAQGDKDLIDGKHFPTRVFLFRLEDGKLLLHVRRDETGVITGARPMADPAVEASRLRQIRGCQLADDVRSLLPE